MFGSNLKVHFAGSDNSVTHMISASLANVNYSLFTCYPFIKGKKVDSDMTYPDNKIFVPKLIQPLRKHIIMDSGLFTLMFGAEKGNQQTVKSLTEWQDKTANFVNQNKLTCTCVEIDCQKVLGVKEAWYFRERMKKVMPNNRHINVFHLEDGSKGLDRLIEFSDYIAFSVPELRIHRPKTYRKDLKALTYYTKNKKPKIDIHLLGCTENDLLKDNKFCTSSDSTSWLAANRYGRMAYKKYHVNDISQNARRSIRSKIINQYNQYCKDGLTDKKVKYMEDAYFNAVICRKKYESMVGSQE